LAKLIDQVSLANNSSIVTKSAKPITLIGSADLPMTNPVNSSEKLSNQPDLTSSDVGADLEDWRTPLLRYLCDPSAKVDKKCSAEHFQICIA
jgi:hypothetical protein